MTLVPLLDIKLLETYDYVYDMKINHGHTNESLTKLFGIGLQAVKTRVSKHKISTKQLSKGIRLDKLDLTKPILEYSVNTITKVKELSDRLIRETSILDVYGDKCKNNHRYHFLKNNLSSIPKCIGCRNITSLDCTHHKNVFQSYCSHSCNSTSSPLSLKTLELISNKDWLYAKRITEKLSYEDIAILAGISTTVVKSWISKHNIDDVKYSWKTSVNLDLVISTRTFTKGMTIYGEDIYNKMLDKNFLYDEYITNRKSAMQISNELGVGSESIRLLLLKYKITDNFNRRYFNKTSKEELQVYEFIKSYYPSAISGYRKLYKKSELDVYIPELNIGFEYNGCYNHSEARRHKDYHINKLNYWNSLGIRVIQIWSDDWIYHTDKIKAMIITRLGLVKKSIHARKCTVNNISHTDYNNFLISNHSLSGNYCSTRLGLFHNDLLVAVMGFKKTATNNNKIGFDLCRFSTLDVHGSFSKLLKYFRYQHLESIIYSIADLEIVDRYKNVYKSHGFIEDYDIKPDYQYYNPKLKIRQDKRIWRKKSFIKFGYDIINKSERELALDFGLLRCYDSGKIMYKLLP